MAPMNDSISPDALRPPEQELVSGLLEVGKVTKFITSNAVLRRAYPWSFYTAGLAAGVRPGIASCLI